LELLRIDAIPNLAFKQPAGHQFLFLAGTRFDETIKGTISGAARAKRNP
jgi:hypothetical protein